MRDRAMGRIAWLLAAAALMTATPDVKGQARNPGNATDVEGRLEVRYEDSTGGARLRHFLHTPARRFELVFTDDAPDIPTDSRVRVHGNLSANSLMLTSSGANVQALALASPNTFGVQQTLVMLMNFQDNLTQPYTVASAQNVTFAQTSSYYLENTYQQTSLAGTVTGWYALPVISTSCDTDTWASLADQAATTSGIDVAAYPRRIYAFPQTPACGWWGLGTVGGNPSRAWINGNYALRVVAHELGHNFGDYHSHSMACDTVGCTTSEYGDDRDIMGATIGHMNAFQKERLGWLNYGASPPIQTVSTTNNYWIEAIETEGSGGAKALKVLQSSDKSGRTWYYIEARAQVGVDSALTPGVIVHSAYDAYGDSSYEKDMQPSTATWDSTLDVGESFTDAARALTITTLSADNSGALVQVAFGSSAQADVTVGTNQLVYSASQKVAISVSVTAGSAAVAGAPVSVAITKPTGIVATLTGKTGPTGVAAFTYRLNRNDPKGAYAIAASSGNSVATTSFVVQ